MNCPENTVKTRMFYARKHLQQLMQEEAPPATAVATDVAPTVTTSAAPSIAALVATTAVAASLESASVEDA